MKRPVSLVASVLIGLAIQGCGGGGGEPPIKVAADPAEVWTMVPAAEVGMDGAKLARAASDLPDPGQHGLASMLVLRKGKPVFEQYWNGSDKDSMHDMRSATKSITALLVGIAIDKKILSGVNEPIATHLAPLYPSAPALKSTIVLHNVLTMSSGLACDDRNSNSPGNEERMYPTGDWTAFFVNLPARVAPGNATDYCTAGVVTLGRIVAEASKQAIPQFADTNLFAPLGIKNRRWADYDNHRHTDTGGHLFLRPRDMAKIGQLVAQNGMWNGSQLVSAEWIKQATMKHTIIDGNHEYGYLWWIKRQAYQGGAVTLVHARGNGGQYIFVIPELELVAVFTGENYNSPKADRPFGILRDYILPAIN